MRVAAAPPRAREPTPRGTAGGFLEATGDVAGAGAAIGSEGAGDDVGSEDMVVHDERKRASTAYNHAHFHEVIQGPRPALAPGVPAGWAWRTLADRVASAIYTLD